MRLSVVLPTRNGGHMLEACLRSVLEQSYSDMEVIVSDNASDDSTPDVLARFAGDPRLKVLRLDEPVEVTDNWINAFEASGGDYILLIGDDDYLLPNSCARLDSLIDNYEEPDCLIYNAYAYAFPGALAGHPESHYADPFFGWDPALPPDGFIPPSLRRELVRDFFRFHFRIHLNLQTTVVSRRAIDRMTNGFLKPPFPDFYALNALMLIADTWACSPEKLIVVGISRKSFGHTVHGHDRAQGLEYLGISPEFPGHLPGNEIANGTYECLLALKRDYGPELRGIDIDRSQYVFDQVYSWYLQWRLGGIGARAVARRLRLLRGSDWLSLGRGFATNLSLARVRRNVRIDRDDPVEHLWPGLRPLPVVADIEEFARWIGAERAAGAPR